MGNFKIFEKFKILNRLGFLGYVYGNNLNILINMCFPDLGGPIDWQSDSR